MYILFDDLPGDTVMRALLKDVVVYNSVDPMQKWLSLTSLVLPKKNILKKKLSQLRLQCSQANFKVNKSTLVQQLFLHWVQSPCTFFLISNLSKLLLAKY